MQRKAEHSGSIANLEAAFNGFQTVMKSWTREGHPDIWADVQDRSGAVLRLMSQSYREPVVLEEAIAAFDRALEIRLPRGAPKLWAMTAANRAETLLRLGGAPARSDHGPAGPRRPDEGRRIAAGRWLCA